MNNIKRIGRSVPIKRVGKIQSDQDYPARYKRDSNKKKEQKLNNSIIDEFI